MKKFSRIFIYAVSFTMITVCSYAQPGVGDPTDGNPTPITGIEILVAIGSLFGVKKIVDYKRRK